MQRKKKVDYTALMSVFARIPGMNVAAARALLDLGLQHVEDLRGRSPESLYEQLKQLPNHPQAPRELLYAFRLAVYFSETDKPDPKKLQTWHWQD